MNQIDPTRGSDQESPVQYLISNAKEIGGQLIEHSLKLWLTIRSPHTPTAIKAPLIAALAYLGCPLDAVPDVIPFVGFADDAAVISTVLVMAHLYITDDIADEAKEIRARIFG